MDVRDKEIYEMREIKIIFWSLTINLKIIRASAPQSDRGLQLCKQDMYRTQPQQKYTKRFRSLPNQQV